MVNNTGYFFFAKTFSLGFIKTNWSIYIFRMWINLGFLCKNNTNFSFFFNKNLGIEQEIVSKEWGIVLESVINLVFYKNITNVLYFPSLGQLTKTDLDFGIEVCFGGWEELIFYLSINNAFSLFFLP